MDSMSKLMKTEGFEFSKQVGEIQNTYLKIRGFRKGHRALIAALRSFFVEQTKGKVLSEDDADVKTRIVLQRAGIRVGRHPY